MNSLISVKEHDSIAQAASSIRIEANIGRLLRDAGKLRPEDMERVLKLQEAQNLRFGEAAQKLGLVTEADIQEALSQQFEYPYLVAAESGLSPDIAAAMRPHSAEAEALRSVRSELLLRWFNDGRKTLAIGSARADEGASTLAANLAVLFAQMGRKVLLIDANMRQPRQQAIFNVGKGMGLSDVLAERVASLELSPIQPFHTLSVLQAGSPPPNPAELLARPGFGAMLSGFEASYDIVLIDTPPSQLASDFLLVAARVGGMLVAARRNVSRVGPLTEFKEKLALTGAQVVGAVVMD